MKERLKINQQAYSIHTTEEEEVDDDEKMTLNGFRLKYWC